MLNYAILAEREKDLLLILHGYARRSILVSGRLLIFALRGGYGREGAINPHKR
jgi:hypothetical protein